MQGWKIRSVKQVINAGLWDSQKGMNIEALRKNPNVAAVSATTVKFTEEFKRIIYEGKKQGVSVSATLRQNGIDPEMLGPSRVEGLSHSGCLYTRDAGLPTQRQPHG